LLEELPTFGKKKKNVNGFDPEEDPGVLSVRKIYTYYKKYNYKTIVMGASFRSRQQVLALAGCDYLTISPNYLQEMASCNDPVVKKLDASSADTSNLEKVTFDEKLFRYELGKDLCATYKLAEGINSFAQAVEKLESLLLKKIQEK